MTPVHVICQVGVNNFLQHLAQPSRDGTDLNIKGLFLGSAKIRPTTSVHFFFPLYIMF